ncbi:MAG: hypothetical protein NDF55_00920 [archaeon GB-1867-005]|nr:hypothetical protein [Candidatus Culexmicrobium cathedralense]
MLEYCKFNQKITHNGNLIIILYSILVITNYVNNHVFVGKDIWFEAEHWIGEQIVLTVHPNGSITVIICTYSDKLFIDLSDINAKFGFSIICLYEKEIYLNIRFDLSSISLEEAELKSYNIVSRLQDILGMNFVLASEDRVDYVTSAGIRSFVTFIYKPTEYNFEKIIDLFLQVKPDSGFSLLINKDIISKNSYLKINIYYAYQTREIRVNLIFKKIFNAYFKFKEGEKYVLDVFKLFNFTGNIVSHRSLDTLFWIYFDYAYGIDFKFLDIRIPCYYSVHRSSGAREYIITNEPWYIPSGTNIDGMVIKFMVIEKGFRLTPYSIRILGYVILLLLVFVVCFLFYRLKLFEMIFKKYIASLYNVIWRGCCES